MFGFRASSSFFSLGIPSFILVPNLLLWSLLFSLDSSSSSSDEELLDEIDAKHQIVMQTTITCVNTWEFFTPIELEECGEQFVDLNIGVQDVLMTMWDMPSLLKSLTNFNLIEFEVGTACGPHHHWSCEIHWGTTPISRHYPSWPWNNVCSISSCIWNMIMSPNMMHSCGIRARVQ